MLFRSPEGKVFDRWVSEDGVVFADAGAEETTFTMPGEAVTVAATYKDKAVISSIDKTDLQKLYDEYRELKQDNYTDSSWNAFQKALENAKEILADQTVTQDEVDAAAQALQQAYEALEIADRDTAISDNEQKSSVQTGDDITIPLMGVMLLIIISGAYIVVFLRHKIK